MQTEREKKQQPEPNWLDVCIEQGPTVPGCKLCASMDPLSKENITASSRINSDIAQQSAVTPLRHSILGVVSDVAMG